MYAGCVSGAIQKDEYLQIIKDSGFENIEVQKNKKIHLPDEILLAYLSEEEMISVNNNQLGIFSITVYAEKPSLTKAQKEETKAACCGPNSSCC